MLHLKESSIVYVACPAHVATGGPTLLHQLTLKLRERGIISKMYYVGKFTESTPVHPNYAKYHLPFVLDFEDDSNNVLIIPESFSSIFYQFNKTRKIFWWLSVDFYLYQMSGRKNRIRHFLHIHQSTYFIDRDKNQQTIHWAQSAYAMEFLAKYKRPHIYSLSDYLDQTFIDKSFDIDLDAKENIVLYNPKKGWEFTKKIIDASPELNWIAIENLSPAEVAELLARSKVYIDFGNHPGKDRFPREAAICKCCVITGKRGSAAFKQDVPIPDPYKFADNQTEIPNIIAKIKQCLDHFHNHLMDFTPYHEMIMNEENVFNEQLDFLMVKTD